MLNEVDQAIKKSKLFSMTQLSAAEMRNNAKFDDRKSRDKAVIERTLETMMGSARESVNVADRAGLRKSISTSSFKSTQSQNNNENNSAKRPDKAASSLINKQSPRAKLDRTREAEKLLQFQEYLAHEIRDVADFKRFLGQLRETIKK